MTTRTMFHVTDASNAASIREEGLQPDERGLVFLAGSKDEAESIGQIYDTIDELAVFRAEVRECHLREDPDPHGDLDSHAHRGAIMPTKLEEL